MSLVTTRSGVQSSPLAPHNRKCVARASLERGAGVALRVNRSRPTVQSLGDEVGAEVDFSSTNHRTSTPAVEEEGADAVWRILAQHLVWHRIDALYFAFRGEAKNAVRYRMRVGPYADTQLVGVRKMMDVAEVPVDDEQVCANHDHRLFADCGPYFTAGRASDFRNASQTLRKRHCCHLLLAFFQPQFHQTLGPVRTGLVVTELLHVLVQLERVELAHVELLGDFAEKLLRTEEAEQALERGAALAVQTSWPSRIRHIAFFGSSPSDFVR